VIDTYNIGGLGKGILLFFKNGGRDLCAPIIAGFWRGPEGKWQFRDAVKALDIRFEVLRQTFAYDPSVIFDALKVVRANNVDILESHGYKGHIVCLVLKKLTKRPWIAYVHGWTNENLKVALYNMIEKVVVRFADKIIPVSENVRTRLHLGWKANARAVVITNAAEFVRINKESVCQRERYGVLKDEILIIVVGRLSPEKGVSYFIDALKTVADKFANVKAVIVGDGQERETLAKKIKQEGINNKIALAGYQEDVNSYYSACDIVCLPSLSEGMPYVALEAMMFAKPVVATDVGGIPEVVLDGKTGILVEAKNPMALADALLYLMGDPWRMKELGIAGKLRVEAEFNPLNRAQKISQVYQSVLRGQKRLNG
jgi:glycosyltransferase involved in cell wall biosynthesis